jgi:hypothetical protein
MKGMSSLQLSRMLGVSYKSTWFMMHRIREAMRDGQLGPIGGQNKVVRLGQRSCAFKEAAQGHRREASHLSTA